VTRSTDPFNDVLNYCYTLLEVETQISCEAVGLDPDLGPLHTDDRLRESFIYDLLEPLRSKADVWVLELLRRERLHPAMFHELRDGVVRLDPDLTGLVALALMPLSQGRAGDRERLRQATAPDQRSAAAAPRGAQADRTAARIMETGRVRLLQGVPAAQRPKVLRALLLSAVQRRNGQADREGAGATGGNAGCGIEPGPWGRGGTKARGSAC
jgi:hypothetical protein